MVSQWKVNYKRTGVLKYMPRTRNTAHWQYKNARTTTKEVQKIENPFAKTFSLNLTASFVRFKKMLLRNFNMIELLFWKTTRIYEVGPF